MFGDGNVRYHLALIRPLELAHGKRGHELTVDDVAGGAKRVIHIVDADLPNTEAFVTKVNAAIGAARGQ